MSLPVAVLCLALVLSGCAQTVDGTPVGHPVANADLPVRGDSGDAFDTEVKNAISDVTAFWRVAYPEISGGKSLPPLKGALYSIDGLQVLRTRTLPAYARSDACLRRDKLFIIDNAAYCELDDSILWDRSPDHLLPSLTNKYGAALTALVFAHEFGHAIQHRIGIPENTPTIDAESQADCAAGAFIAAAMHGEAPHFRLTSAQVDSALDGFLQFRDTSGVSSENASHGDGFDRLSALQHGITGGPSYCFSSSYFANLTFTERQYTDQQDFDDNGNVPLSEVVSTAKGGLIADLNRFWTQQGTTVDHTFAAVKVAAADRPPCASSDAVQFGYCPDDNTVYYSASFAHRAYYSLSALSANHATGNVTIEQNQPADFALGAMLAIAWGMAARHQFFGESIDDAAGLTAAICYAGAYAENINPPSSPGFALSPPDLDEATSAVLNLVELDSAFGARGTTGLERVTAFVTGYDKGLHSC